MILDRIRTVVGCGLVLAALAGLGCQSRPPKVRTAIELSLEALEKTGVKAYEEGRFPSALKLFRESESLARSTDNRVALANAFNNQGAVLKEMGEAEQAARALENALRLNTAHGLTGAKAVNLANLASLELDRPKVSLDRAAEFNRRARALFDDLGHDLGEVLVRNNEGRILLKRGRVQEAREVFEDALSDAGDAEGARLRAVLLANRGRTFEAVSDLDAAERDYRAALDLDRELEVFTGVARNLEAIARIQRQRGNRGEAAKSLLRALDVVLLRVRWKPWVDRALADAEKLLRELGRAKEAKDLRARVEKELERSRKEEEKIERLRKKLPMGDID
jgi:tetratricopeptide (TPR) repeat protein